jgi:hypothetical protein
MNRKIPWLFFLLACGVEPAGETKSALLSARYYFVSADRATDVSTGASEAIKAIEGLPLDAKLDELVIYGTVRSRTLYAQAAFRALPGLLPAKVEQVFTPADAIDAVKIDLGPALEPFVDERWLRHRIDQKRAVLAGRFFSPGTFSVTVLYLELPEAVACNELAAPSCGKGQTPVFRRDEERCVFSAGCIEALACNLFFQPQCADGYRAVRWAQGPDGCEQLACDPDWSSP